MSKNDFSSFSCIMLAFKIGKKAEFVDNVAHWSSCHLEIDNTFLRSLETNWVVSVSS